MDFVTGERFRAGVGYTATPRPTIVLHRLGRTRSEVETRAPSLLAIQIGGNFLSAFLTSCIGGGQGEEEEEEEEGPASVPLLSGCVSAGAPAPKLPFALIKAALAILRTTRARLGTTSNNWASPRSRDSPAPFSLFAQSLRVAGTTAMTMTGEISEP